MLQVEGSAGDVLIEQMMLFAHRSFCASSIVFYWVDDSTEMADFRADGAPGDFMHRYVSEMKQFDPLLVSRISRDGKRIARLADEWENVSPDQSGIYRRFLHSYDIIDNIDLVFWHDGAPVAGLGILPHRGDVPIERLGLNLGAMQRYFEFSLAFHPRLRARQLRRHFRLSPREVDVAALIGAGASNQDIAGQLNIGIATVKTHVLGILAKLGVESRAGIAATVADFGHLAGPAAHRDISR